MKRLYNYKLYEKLILSTDIWAIVNELFTKDKVAYLLRQLAFRDIYAEEEEVNFIELAKEINKFSFMPTNRRAGLEFDDKFNPDSMPTRIGRIVKKIYDKVKKCMILTTSCKVVVKHVIKIAVYEDLTYILNLQDIIPNKKELEFIFADAQNYSSNIPPAKIKFKCKGWYNDRDELQEIADGAEIEGDLIFADVVWLTNDLQIRVISSQLHDLIQKMNEKGLDLPMSFSFDLEMISNLIITDTDIENFVNNTIAIIKRSKSSENSQIKVVSGEDIAYWYDEDNYQLISGELGNSCMRNVNSNFFSIYCENPEVVSMLILTKINEDGKEKLIARALLWKMTNGEYLLDRVYAIMRSDALLLQNWAEEKNYYYVKKGDVFRSSNKISLSGLSKLNVELEDWDFDYYPYLDTFQILDNDDGILYIETDEGILDRRTLCSTTGKWEEWHEVYSDDDDDHEDQNDYDDDYGVIKI